MKLWANNNKKRSEILGMSYRAAKAKLIKMLLFSLAQQLNKDICIRCDNKIIDLKSFSIDHKEGWQLLENPLESFFDLTKIGFSHFSCNAKSISHYNNRKTHCKNGHEFTVKNTFIRKDKARDCRTCHKNRIKKVRNIKRFSLKAEHSAFNTEKRDRYP